MNKQEIGIFIIENMISIIGVLFLIYLAWQLLKKRDKKFWNDCGEKRIQELIEMECSIEFMEKYVQNLKDDKFSFKNGYYEGSYWALERHKTRESGKELRDLLIKATKRS